MPDGSSRPDVEELHVFAVGVDGELVSIDPTDHQSTDPGQIDLRAAGTEALGHLRELRAKPGYRLGPTTDRSDRRGHHEEVAQPVFVKPRHATQVALTGALFAEPLPGLDVDVDSRTQEGDSLRWAVRVRTGRFRRRREAALSMHPSPSANLSVIELIPKKPERFQTGRFVQAGVLAVDTLGNRLARQARDFSAVHG